MKTLKKNCNQFGPIWTDLNGFGPIWTDLDQFRPLKQFQTSLNTFRQVWAISDNLDQFQTSLDQFGQV